CCCCVCLYQLVNFALLVFMRRDKAHEVLRVHKRANYFLEEIRPGNLERECNEEKCSFEEAKEIFHSQEKTSYTIPCFFSIGLNPCSTNPCNNGGVCKIRHYSYFCICPPEFGGHNCETGDCDRAVPGVLLAERLECWYKNGGCWHYCRDGNSALHVVCSCARDYALQEDGKRCVQADVLDMPQPTQTNISSTLEHYDSRITGGTLCHRGHCPWQVLLRNSRDVGFCGGSLIGRRWVLTAAHCLDLVSPQHVTLGEHGAPLAAAEQKIAVERSWTHPHYNSDNYNSDIALLYLSSAAVLNEYVIPICLPSPNLAALLSEEGRVGMVSGWGATHQRGSTLRYLMKVRLPIVGLEPCQQAMDRLLTDSMFCAGHSTATADACKGDSGGPFTVSHHNTWFLLGIVSWGEGCAEQGKYGVYTRVSNFIPWIKEVVE
ncbi:FAXD protein, partial [Callaeas wilsoni]|nr:FAXD protein [Callaeas wilsoni]